MKKRNIIIALLAGLAGSSGCAVAINGELCQKLSPIVAVEAPEPPVVAPKYANAPEITAKAGFLLEGNSGKVLFAQNADARLPIASMTKVATLGVIYDALAQGQIQMDDLVTVSDYAASMGGSQAFLDAGSQYPVRELIKSIVVASANDSCVALAEHIAGSVESFVQRMNQFAAACGGQNTNFVNCTGLPTPGAYSCARDMAYMYQKIMQSPHYGDFNQVWMYDLTHPSGRVTGLTNTNKLIKAYNGCVGGKTGFTNEAGHCLTVAAERGDLRPIAVIIGAADSKTRFNESRKLLDYACTNFENRLIVDHTQPISQAKVKNAVTNTVDLYPAQDFYYLTPKGETANVALATQIPPVLTAPVRQTDAVGQICVTADGKVIAEIPVHPPAAIPAASYWDTVRKVVHGARLCKHNSRPYGATERI